MSDEIDRRRFVGAAAMTIAAAKLGIVGLPATQSRTTKLAGLSTMKPGTHTSFGPLKQIDAGLLNVGYAEAGPADGPAVVQGSRLRQRVSDHEPESERTPVAAPGRMGMVVPVLFRHGTRPDRLRQQPVRL
jgi:hypothetical protein